ncbi:MAG: HEAT repeat domain-containing protein [Planctomycetaceae bacterium]|nr:hypothetical protein [Planctomycetaceae bacterium]
MTSQPVLTPPPPPAWALRPQPWSRRRKLVAIFAPIALIAAVATATICYFTSDAVRAAELIHELRHPPEQGALSRLMGEDPPAARPDGVIVAELGGLGSGAVSVIIEAIEREDTPQAVAEEDEFYRQMHGRLVRQGRRDLLIRALGLIGPRAKAAVLPMVKWLQLPQYRYSRYEIVAALGNIGPDAAAAMPLILKVLDEQEDFRQGQMVIRACGQLGPAAVGAVPFFIKAIEGKRSYMDDRDMEIYIEAIAGIGQPALQHLDPLMSDEEDNLRRLAWQSMARMGPAGLTALVQHLESPSRRARACAALGLEKLGAKAAPALKAIVAATNAENNQISTNSRHATVSGSLISVLIEIGPAAEPGLQEIARITTDDMLKSWAEDALNTIRASKP